MVKALQVSVTNSLRRHVDLEIERGTNRAADGLRGDRRGRN
jgi:hypothetical protein